MQLTRVDPRRPARRIAAPATRRSRPPTARPCGATASSSASGIPSRCSQMRRTTADGVSASAVVPTTNTLRSRKSRSASPGSPSPDTARPDGETLFALDAERNSAGGEDRGQASVPASTAPASAATSSATCSQLSRTSSIDDVRSASARASTGWAGSSTETCNTAATVVATAEADVTGARSTSHAPSLNRCATLEATSTASLRLADPSRSGHGDEPMVSEEVGQTLALVDPTDEARQRRRQVPDDLEAPASSAGSCSRICSSNSSRARDGSMPSSSPSRSRMLRNSRSASACHPAGDTAFASAVRERSRRVVARRRAAAPRPSAACHRREGARRPDPGGRCTEAPPDERSRAPAIRCPPCLRTGAPARTRQCIGDQRGRSSGVVGKHPPRSGKVVLEGDRVDLVDVVDGEPVAGGVAGDAPSAEHSSQVGDVGVQRRPRTWSSAPSPQTSSMIRSAATGRPGSTSRTASTARWSGPPRATGSESPSAAIGPNTT